MTAAALKAARRGARMFDLFRRLKADAARFSGAFWTGFEQARAHDREFAGTPFEGLSVDEVKATLAAAIRGAHDAGMAAEKRPFEEILQAPGASTFPELAIDLALGTATREQAAGVLARAETDAATRAGLMKSNLLDRAGADVPTLH